MKIKIVPLVEFLKEDLIITIDQVTVTAIIHTIVIILITMIHLFILIFILVVSLYLPEL
jgi:hypothetical protein